MFTDWLQDWAMWQVIGMYIGFGLLGLFVLTLVTYCVVILIQQTHRKHSKNWVWDAVRGRFVKREIAEIEGWCKRDEK